MWLLLLLLFSWRRSSPSPRLTRDLSDQSGRCVGESFAVRATTSSSRSLTRLRWSTVVWVGCRPPASTRVSLLSLICVRGPCLNDKEAKLLLVQPARVQMPHDPSVLLPRTSRNLLLACFPDIGSNPVVFRSGHVSASQLVFFLGNSVELRQHCFRIMSVFGVFFAAPTLERFVSCRCAMHSHLDRSQQR